MKRILILDDESIRHDAYDRAYAPHAEVWHAYTPAQFRRHFEKTTFDIVSFDHDIGEVGETGLDLAKWMLTLPREKWPQICVVHSWNPSGAERILRVLGDAGIATRRKPFAQGGVP